MPVTQTALGEACEHLRAHLGTELTNRGQASTVLLGNLTDASAAVTAGETVLNLLVYRVESDGSVGGHNDPTMPWMLRLHVLVTAFSADETPSIGHNEMRLLGSVAAILHQMPILPLVDTDGGPVALNIVPEMLSVETLNQLWSMHGDVTFRPSLGYQVGLVPVAEGPTVRPPQPLVGHVRADIDSITGDPIDLPGRVTPGGRADLRFTGPFEDDTTPVAGDTPAEAAARAARAHTDAARLRVFELGSARLDAFVASVTVVADRPRVQLVWEVRTGRGPLQRAMPANAPVVVDAVVASRLPEHVDPADHPARLPGVQIHEVELPAAGDLPDDGAYQLVLRPLAHDAADPIAAPALPGRPVVVSVHDPAVP